jgi:hypothetical protein
MLYSEGRHRASGGAKGTSGGASSTSGGASDTSADAKGRQRTPAFSATIFRNSFVTNDLSLKIRSTKHEFRNKFEYRFAAREYACQARIFKQIRIIFCAYSAAFCSIQQHSEAIQSIYRTPLEATQKLCRTKSETPKNREKAHLDADCNAWLAKYACRRLQFMSKSKEKRKWPAWPVSGCQFFSLSRVYG